MAAGPTTRPHILAPISVSDTTDLNALFEPFFGKAPSGPIFTDPYALQANQNYALPDAFKGRSNYLGQTIKIMILTEDDWYTKVMLPITEQQDISITWNTWTFNQHRMPVVPEEAPSRLVTSSKQGHAASMERVGLAMMLEHGFMKTKEGVENYIYNLQQLILAVSETNKTDIITAYLSCNDVNRAWEKNNGNYSSRTIKQRLDMDRDNWAICQKDDQGLIKLDVNSDEEMTRYRGRADTWILPPKVPIHNMFEPRNTDYYMSGQTANYDSVNSFGSIRNKRVYLTRRFDIGVGELREITSRDRQIGSYYTMVDRYSEDRSISDHAYTNEELSIVVYDEDSDSWAKLSPSLGVAHCNLLDRNGNLRGPDDLGPNGDLFAISNPEDAQNDFLTMPEHDNDPKGPLRPMVPIEVIGHIAEKHLKTSSLVNNHASTALKSLNLSSNVISDTSLLLDNIIENNKKVLNEAEILDLLDLANLKTVPANETTYEKALGRGLQYYDFKPAAEKAVTRDIYKDPSTQKFLSKLKNLFPGSVFLDERWGTQAGGILKGPSPGRVFLENLLGGFGLSVWVRRAAPRAGGQDDQLTALDKTNLVTLQSMAPTLQNLTANIANTNDFVTSLQAFFGVDNNWVYRNEPIVNDQDDVNGDQDELERAVGKHQILKMLTRQANGKMADAANPRYEAVKTVMPGGPSQAKFLFRSKLVSLIQLVTLRSAAKATNAPEGLKVTAALKAAVDAMAFVLGSKVAAGLKPTGGPKSLKDLFEAAAKAGQVALDGALGKGVFPDPLAMITDIEAAEANDAPLAGMVAANLPAENQGAFYITPLVLSNDQMRGLLANLLGEANTADAAQAKLNKSQITFSSVNDPAEPITLGKEILTLRAMFNKADFEKDHGWDTSNVRSLLVTRSISTHLENVAGGGGGVKRKPLREAAGGPSSKRRNRAEANLMDWEDSDDGGDGYEDARDAHGAGIPHDAFVPKLFNARFAKRFAKIDAMNGHSLLKFIAKVMAATPFNRKTLDAFINNHILLPMGFLVTMPHANYEMELGIKALAGKETGNTYMGHLSFEVSDDGARKMHLGYLTLYMKPVVRKPENVRVFYDIFSKRCKGGAGVVPIDVSKYKPRQQLMGEGSLLFLAVPYEQQTFPNPLDLSGHFSYFADTSNVDRVKDAKPHYNTAYRYNRMYGWRITDDNAKYEVEHYFHPLVWTQSTNPMPFNTVCYWGEEFYYDRSANVRRHTLEHENTGHWGPFCRPGVRKLRDGDLTPWKQPLAIMGGSNSIIGIKSQ